MNKLIGTLFFSLAVVGSWQCTPDYSNKIIGQFQTQWIRTPAKIFYTLKFEHDSVYGIDDFDMTIKGTFQVDSDSLHIWFSQLDKVSYKIEDFDGDLMILTQGKDTFNYNRTPANYLNLHDYYQLIGLQEDSIFKPKDLVNHGIIHAYIKNDSLKIRLNDAIKPITAINYFLEGHHGPGPLPLLLIGEGVSLEDLNKIYIELYLSGKYKVNLGLSKTPMNDLMVYSDRIGLLNFKEAEFLPPPPPNPLDTSGSAFISIKALEDLEKLDFQKFPNMVCYEIDDQISIVMYISIKKRIMQLSKQFNKRFIYVHSKEIVRSNLGE